MVFLNKKASGSGLEIAANGDILRFGMTPPTESTEHISEVFIGVVVPAEAGYSFMASSPA